MTFAKGRDGKEFSDGISRHKRLKLGEGAYYT